MAETTTVVVQKTKRTSLRRTSAPVAPAQDDSVQTTLFTPTGETTATEVTVTKPKRASRVHTKPKEATKPEVKTGEVPTTANETPAPATETTTQTTQETAPAPAPAQTTKGKKVNVQFVGRKMDRTKPVHVLPEDARPVGGSRLFAHTHAALTVMGLLDAARPAVPRSHVMTIMGGTAVSYHTKQGNFESAPESGLRLSIRGYNKFKDRAVDASLAMAFQSMFLDGEVTKELGVSKNNVYQVALG